MLGKGAHVFHNIDDAHDLGVIRAKTCENSVVALTLQPDV